MQEATGRARVVSNDVVDALTSPLNRLEAEMNAPLTRRKRSIAWNQFSNLSNMPLCDVQRGEKKVLLVFGLIRPALLFDR